MPCYNNVTKVIIFIILSFIVYPLGLILLGYGVESYLVANGTLSPDIAPDTKAAILANLFLFLVWIMLVIRLYLKTFPELKSH